MDYLVVYASKTGNTQKIAMEIFETIPGKSKDIQSIEEYTGEEANTYFVGFWNNRGTCSSEIMEFLSGLQNKKVALFGTCGMSGNQEYFQMIANQVAAFIPESCEYLGSFMCAGRMPPKILEKYQAMQSIQDSSQIRSMIQGYEQAMLHPDEEDFCSARKFASEILGHI